MGSVPGRIQGTRERTWTIRGQINLKGVETSVYGDVGYKSVTSTAVSGAIIED